MATLNLSKHIDSIARINPLKEAPYLYSSETWSKLSPKYKKLIVKFENKEISRATIIDAYKDYYSHSSDFMKAFVLTMIWGFAKNGYGTYRTNKYLEEPNNISIVKSAIDAIKQGELEFAFESLKQIKGLGVSYITKVLYFATRAAKIREYALIYDIRVASALVKLTTPKEIFSIVKVSPSSKFEVYNTYNKMLHAMALKYKLKADQIEIFLFNQNF